MGLGCSPVGKVLLYVQELWCGFPTVHKPGTDRCAPAISAFGGRQEGQEFKTSLSSIELEAGETRHGGPHSSS